MYGINRLNRFMYDTTTNKQTLTLQGTSWSVDTEHDLSLSNSSYVLHGMSLV